MQNKAQETNPGLGTNADRGDPTVDFVAGTCAGIVGLIVGFPLDTVKVRFQDPETARNYRGASTLTTVTKIVKEEGVRGLYKGITSPMNPTCDFQAGCAFLNGLVFSSYGFLMRLQLQHDSDEPTLAQIGLAGAGSGLTASLVTCPTELIKIRQQALINSQPSSREVVIGIIRKSGLRGLFRGITATALRDCGYGAYFATYEGACRLLRPSPAPPHAHSSLASETDAERCLLPWPRLMLAGGFAGIIGWLATFGLDVVKTRIQGLRVFFIGLAPTLIRAFPVNMATFGAFELVTKALT